MARAAKLARPLIAASLLASLVIACSGEDDKAKPVTTKPPSEATESEKLLMFAPGAAPDIVVDAAQSVPVKPVNGLLASMSVAAPPDDLIKPIAPIQVRGWSGNVPVERVQQLPARWFMLLSDAWGYKSENYPNGAGKAPYEDELGWDTKVAEQVHTTHGRADVVYEPWSAPDIPDFFGGTEEQANRTWVLAYSAVRRELGPNALMAGPSISRYDPDRITRFLEFCLVAGCQVDVLTWQELVPPPGDISQISAHLADARTKFLENPRYARLGIKEINITEYGSTEDQYRPGENVAYLAALEAGKADGAGRSCFTAPKESKTSTGTSMSNCYNETLDGLLGPTSKQPNGVWYVMEAYAKGLAGRVASTSPAGLSTVAGMPNVLSNETTIIVGNHRSATGNSDTRSALVELKGLTAVPTLKAAPKLEVEVRVVGPAVEGEIGDSRYLKASTPVTDGSTKLNLPDIPAGGAAIVVIRPAATP